MPQGCEQCRWMRGTLEVLEATVEGLQYELHVREIRLQERERRIAELEQQVEDLKKQAMNAQQGEPAPPPPFVKAEKGQDPLRSRTL